MNAKVDEAKTANPQFAGKALVVDYGPEKGQHWLIPAKDPRRALFDALGFAAQAESEDVSEERLDLLDRDVLFVNGATKGHAGLAGVQQAQGGHRGPHAVHVVLDAAGRGAVLQRARRAAYALDLLVPQLKAATDGDPATAVPDLSSVS